MPDEYLVDPPVLLEAAAWIHVAAEDMPTIKGTFRGAVDQVEAAAPLDIGGFRDRWSEEMDLLAEMMAGFEEALLTSAEVYAETDLQWARLLGLEEG